MANVDPVSDFLAREQDALADLDLNDDDAPLAAPVHAAADIAPAPVQNGLNGGGLPNGGDSGVDLSALDRDTSLASPMQNGGSGTYQLSMSRGGSSARLPPEEEPEKIKKWRENQQQMIVEKDKAEEKKKEELRQQAKKELEEWHAQRKVRLEQRKKENRERESNYREEVGGGGPKAAPPKSVTPGGAGQQVHASPQDWERIAKLVEAGAKSVRGTKDTSRMKSLIIAYASPTGNGESAQ